MASAFNVSNYNGIGLIDKSAYQSPAYLALFPSGPTGWGGNDPSAGGVDNAATSQLQAQGLPMNYAVTKGGVLLQRQTNGDYTPVDPTGGNSLTQGFENYANGLIDTSNTLLNRVAIPGMIAVGTAGLLGGLSGAAGAAGAGSGSGADAAAGSALPSTQIGTGAIGPISGSGAASVAPGSAAMAGGTAAGVASSLPTILQKLAPLAGLVAGKAFSGAGAGASVPPQLNDLLAQALARMKYQNPLFQAATQQAYGGLPTYAKQGIPPPSGSL